MTPPFSYVPLLPTAAGLCCGILAGFYVEAAFSFALSLLFLALGFVFVAVKRWWTMQLFFSVCLGIVSIIDFNPITSEVDGLWSGKVLSVNLYESYSTLAVEIDGRQVKGQFEPISHQTVSITSLVEDFKPSWGDRINFRSTLRPLSEDTDIPYRQSEKDYLSRRGVAATTVLLNSDSARVVSSGGIIPWFNSFRERCRLGILRSKLKAGTKEFVSAIVLGDRSIISEKDKTSFSRAGLSHILALSGLHVGLLAVMLTYLLLPLRPLGVGRRGHGLAVCLLLWSYALITGMSSTVIRAVVMATVLILSRLIDRSHNSYNALLAALIILLLYNPYYLFDIGFILSFAAVLSVLMFSNRLSPFQKRGRPWRGIGQIIGASLAAILGTGFISSSTFHMFSLTFLISNIIVMPVLPFLLGCGVCLSLTLALGFEAKWLCHLTDLAYSWAYKIVSTISSLSWSVIDNIYFPLWLAFLWIGSLLAWNLWIQYRKRYAAVFASVMTLGCLSLLCIELMPDRKLPPTVYLLRDSEYTTLMVHNLSHIHLLSTVPERGADNYKSWFEETNGEFVYKQRVDTITLTGPGLITVLDKRIVLVDNCRKVRKMDSKVDYAVLSRNFTGTVESLTDSIDVATIILSHKIPPKRINSLMDECFDLGIKCVSLRERPYTIDIIAKEF